MYKNIIEVNQVSGFHDFMIVPQKLKAQRLEYTLRSNGYEVDAYYSTHSYHYSEEELYQYGNCWLDIFCGMHFYPIYKNQLSTVGKMRRNF